MLPGSHANASIRASGFVLDALSCGVTAGSHVDVEHLVDRQSAPPDDVFDGQHHLPGNPDELTDEAEVFRVRGPGNNIIRRPTPTHRTRPRPKKLFPPVAIVILGAQLA